MISYFQSLEQQLFALIGNSFNEEEEHAMASLKLQKFSGVERASIAKYFLRKSGNSAVTTENTGHKVRNIENPYYGWNSGRNDWPYESMLFYVLIPFSI